MARDEALLLRDDVGEHLRWCADVAGGAAREGLEGEGQGAMGARSGQGGSGCGRRGAGGARLLAALLDGLQLVRRLRAAGKRRVRGVGFMVSAVLGW